MTPWRCCGKMASASSAGYGAMKVRVIHTLSFPPVLALGIPHSRASIVSPANTSSRTTSTLRGHCGRWNSCGTADGRRSLSSTREVSLSMASSASPWKPDDFYDWHWPYASHLAGSTDEDSFIRTSSPPTCSSIPRPDKCGSPASALLPVSRASASPPSRRSSSQERSPTWRPSKRDE
jgi:hypothetical protein